jgi:rhodanese-related sulfurtransferase
LIPQVTPTQLAQWRDDATREPPLLVDVREPWEFDYCRIEGSHSIPLSQLGQRRSELPTDRPLVMVCHHGLRSQHAAMLLHGAGYTRVHNLQGGVEAWAQDVDPSMPRY